MTRIVVMGVSGSGKSTIAALLAERLGFEYVDADWLHPKANVEKTNLKKPASAAAVKLVILTRNFGHQAAISAGLSYTTGDYVAIMDADLQDPPEVIPQLIEKWRGGADVVHTVRTDRRGESAMKMMLTRLAYRIIHLGSSIELPVDAGDFKLLSRPALHHLLALGESDPYLRGLVVWIGFPQAFVPYEREARHAGTTHFPFFSRNPWKTFAMGLTSFSFMPIFVVIGAAAAATLVTGVLVVSTLALLIARGRIPATLAMVTVGAVFWATTLAAIAAVGIYVIRIYKDVRNRPQYIIESTIGLSKVSEDVLAQRAVR